MRTLSPRGWYRRFIEDYATKAVPLTNLLKRSTKWNWGDEQQRSFDSLKEALSHAPVLACPDFSREFTLQTDASAFGLGLVLTQDLGEGERVIAYASKTLTSTQRNYTVTEIECLAVVWAIQKFREYLEGYQGDN